MSNRQFTLMFNHILPYRGEFQIGVKPRAAEGYFWETELDFIQSKVNPPQRTESI